MSLSNFFTGHDVVRGRREEAAAGQRAARELLSQDRRGGPPWRDGFLKEIDRTMGKFDLPEAVLETNERLSENVLNIVKPITAPSSIFTDYLKGNLPMAIVRGTISLACFHETKERLLKPSARSLRARHPQKMKHAEAVADYLCDVLLPNGLYGPIYLYCLRYARGYLLHRTMKMVHLAD